MLPFLKNANVKSQKQLVAFRGINWSDQYQDGDLADGVNLSARRFPYLSTRLARTKQTEYERATAMTARDKLVVVRERDEEYGDGRKRAHLLYDGKEVFGEVSAGEKQFAVVNTKMVIWPDKKYLDLTDMKIKNLGASASGIGAVFTTDTMTVSGWQDLAAYFVAGDTVTIRGCVHTHNNKDVHVLEVTANTIKVSANGFEAGEETTPVEVERRIPDMDFICESENRLWGCSNQAQTIYTSALGDPTNFFVNEGAATDSWAVAVGTEGEFTGCCKLTSSVLFWKETKLHKLLGSYPAEYAMYTYDIEGLQKGCHKSLQIINETLYYMGLHGVYSYTGGVPNLISAAFGNKILSEAVAGTDGDSYYLSAFDGIKRHLLVYETRKGLWVREDGTKVVDFGRVGNDLYFLDGNGNIWIADSRMQDYSMEWMAQFCPFYETIQGRKRYTKLLMRLQVYEGASMKAEVRFDSGSWRECGKVVGRNVDAIPLQIPINRCDCFELRLSGTGPCTILTMQLEYQVGSEM